MLPAASVTAGKTTDVTTCVVGGGTDDTGLLTEDVTTSGGVEVTSVGGIEDKDVPIVDVVSTTKEDGGAALEKTGVCGVVTRCQCQ